MKYGLLFLLFLLLPLTVLAQEQEDAPETTPPVTTAIPETSATQEIVPPSTAQSIVVPQPTTPAPANATPAPAPTYEAQKFAVLQTLDKLTARTRTVTLPVGQPSAVGPIFIDVKTCQKTPPSEQPESAAFLQIWEAKPKPKMKNAKPDDDDAVSQWVFSGWMFASSPALSAMNHPVYDVWVKDCTNDVATSKQK